MKLLMLSCVRQQQYAAFGPNEVKVTDIMLLAGSVQFGSICFASSVSAFAQSKKNPEDAVQFTIWVSSLFFFSFLFFGRYELREGVEMRKVRNTSWPLHDSYEFHRLLNAFGIVAAALE
eukprot:TRINITY_DN42_c0_g1_i22.p1 TRINITY_DN42_c0_g1~~TRINITY_DN42_c0_g1_i22.p1  ORF type:complete len:119 (-),score=10.00 TRINITY_DN42_c0_g1_i22:81-437(-)